MPNTLLTPNQYREEIKKSRFLALASPVTSAAEAQAFIEQQRDLSASHNCWAWKVGNQYRFSDDGEPGGTAGRPILAAIEGQEIDQVAVLVIRWYGGIQLGTGGLARAYGGSAAKCLQTAEQRPLLTLTRVSCHVLFAELALLNSKLAEFGAQLEQQAFDSTGATLQIALPSATVAELERLLADISRGRASLKVL